jgi:hypothetical protein
MKHLASREVAMESKKPVMLLVLVETTQLRWFVGLLDLEGQAVALICSEPGDLEKYRGLDFDEQVAFLRHRFCGVLQRGCDRTWARACKPFAFVFVFDDLIPEPTGTLTQTFADHLAQWMLNPPVAFFRRTSSLEKLAGDLEPAHEHLLAAHLGKLIELRQDPNAWELSRRKPGG